MWSDTDFFIGFVLPILLMGIAIGFVMFVAVPWAWPFVRDVLSMALG